MQTSDSENIQTKPFPNLDYSDAHGKGEAEKSSSVRHLREVFENVHAASENQTLPPGNIDPESTGGASVDGERLPDRQHSLDGKMHDGKALNRSVYSIDAAHAEAITLTWKNITARIDAEKSHKFKRFFKNCCSFSKEITSNKYKNFQKSKRKILSNVSGVALPGRLLAIMGASGAGKTTLLNVLTHRNIGQLDIEGDLLVNGQSVGSNIRTMAAYVQQDDLFIGTLKVREHLMFQARLRLGKNMPNDQRKKRVDDVINELGLNKCQNTLIGTKQRTGISGGEKKRLAFAAEVLTNPSILICDEPTSGLDSFMAVQVVDVLKKLAEKGKTIVCTIHQPSSFVFEMFDDLCLLANGRVAYLGPASDAWKFFQRNGFPCPQNFNPADHYIRTLAMIPGEENQCKDRIKKICQSYAKSPEAEQLNRMLESVSHEGQQKKTGSTALTKKPKYKATWCQQFNVLLWRSFIGNLREPMLVPVRFFQTVVISVILGLVYFDTKLEGNTGVQNVTGVLFMFVTNMTFQYFWAVVNVFCDELPVFLREHFSGVYRVDTYYLSKIVSELPQYIIFPFIFTVILYFMAGLESNAAIFFIMCGINLLTANVAVSLGYMMSCIFVDSSVAMTVSPVVVIPFMLFAGFYINLDTVPVYFVWLQYLSYFKYAFEALAINQLKDVQNIPGCGPNYTCPSNGMAVLQTLGIKTDRFALDIVVLVVMIIVIRLIAFMALLIRTYVRKD